MERDWRRILRSIFGPIVLALLVAAAYAALIFGYSAFEYEAEWKAEQEDFEALAADVDYEKQRLQTSAESAQIYVSKYSLGSDDVYGIIAGFLNKTLLTVNTYTFMWSKSLTFNRMYDHALQLDDDPNLKFNKPSTKIIDIVFRSILPIFTTFAVGSSVSAIHSIVKNILKVCIPHKKYEAWTVGRNKMLRVSVLANMVLAIGYFVICFFLTTLAASRWQDVSFGDGIKITLNLITTIPPGVRRHSIIDAHTLTALAFLIHSATAYVIFALIQMIKTWRVSAFAVPLISDIDQADRVDKDMQVQYRMRRDELFQQKQEKKTE
uniref:DUF2975 domain-containing protein n=1 Tax=Caenorhabditis tropicalis TaxID=1561998 RepID=A0A1I7UU45_9PELO